MEGWTVGIYVGMMFAMLLTVWRLWVLSRQVRQAGDAASRARSAARASSEPSGGTVVTAYSVELHARSAVSPVTVTREVPGGGRETAQAIPLVMRQSPSSSRLARGVDAGEVTHAVVGSVLFEVLSSAAWRGTEDGGARPWAKPGADRDVLAWAKPLSAGAAASFPFPSLREDGAIQLGEPSGGYSAAVVLAF